MDSAKVKQTLENYFDSYVKDLEFLTNIDSVTGNIEGSRKIASWLEKKIAELGGTSEARDNGNGVHVIARFKGNGQKRVLLMVHTDTVLGTQNGKRLFSMDENKIAYGAGAGDCKASVVQMLYLMKAMKDLGVAPYKEIIIHFDAEEETSTDAELEIATELAQQADYAIICDTGRPGWGICTKRKALAKYTIEIEGTSGHAGNAPHATSNAVAELGYIMTRIHKLATPITDDPENYTKQALQAAGIVDHGQFIPENTINLAVVGTTNEKVNAIPDNAVLKFEVRCYELKEQKRIEEEIRKICETPTIKGVKVKLTGKIEKLPMEKDSEAAKLSDIYKKIVEAEYGADVVEWIAGGLTIGNCTAEYIPTIDALGVEVDPQAEHTLKEYVDLGSFVPRTVALLHMIDQVDGIELKRKANEGI